MMNLFTKLRNKYLVCKLKLAGADCSNVSTLNGMPTLKIEDHASVHLGENVCFNNFWGTGWQGPSALFVKSNACLKIGNNTGLNGVVISCSNHITIGDFCMIGGGTRIYDTNFHNLDWKARRDPIMNGIAKTAPVVIGNDVFIGTGCIIGKGVKIGDRAIIAAGSIVVKDIPEDAVAGGNPCKVLKINGEKVISKSE